MKIAHASQAQVVTYIAATWLLLLSSGTGLLLPLWWILLLPAIVPYCPSTSLRCREFRCQLQPYVSIITKVEAVSR